MCKEYYDSFDCVVTPEELEAFEDWCTELDEEDIRCCNIAEILLINENDIPF